MQFASLRRGVRFNANPRASRLASAPGAKQIVRALTRAGWPAGLRLKLTPAQAGELRQFLHGFLIFHLGRLPKGRAAALANEA